jgi:hypothetical protein
MSIFVPYQIADTATYLQSGENAGGKQLHLGFLLKWGIMNAGIATVARTSNVATITTNAPHGMLVGQKVNVNATTDNSFDALSSAWATVLSVPSTTSFTYASTGTDKAQTADSGTLTSWECVADSTHGSIRNCRLSSIATTGVTIAWDTLPSVGTWKVANATFGNHNGNSAAILTPYHTGVGLNNCGIAFRYRQNIFGRAYWNGTTTGGGITANANWVKEGDTGSVQFVASTINALLVSHSSNLLPTSGSRGASSWALPDLQQVTNGVTPVLPNYQVLPFTAAAYQASTSGFYCQLLDASGTVMDQTALEALSPASRLQRHHVLQH